MKRMEKPIDDINQSIIYYSLKIFSLCTVFFSPRQKEMITIKVLLNLKISIDENNKKIYLYFY